MYLFVVAEDCEFYLGRLEEESKFDEILHRCGCDVQAITGLGEMATIDFVYDHILILASTRSRN